MRLIDADSLKDYIDCGHLRPPTELCFSELDVCNMIDKRPTIDAVEVVRCKDCKDSRVYGKTTQWLACENVMEGQATDPDGYCYLGERKNNAVEESEVEE